MYSIFDEVIKFTEKNMKTWRSELTAKGEKLSWGKDLERCIQGKCIITNIICNRYDDTQPHTQENAQADTNLVRRD